MRRPMQRVFALGLFLFLGACGSSDGGPPQDVSGGSGLQPAGAQDFGRFKAILMKGDVPAPETLDQVGFFAEHKLGTPPTSCAGPVCAQALLGSMANMISGSNCTLIHLGLGSPLDPQAQGRPDLDVAVVVQQDLPDPGPAIAGVRGGLEKLIAGLQARDTFTLVASASTSRLLAERLSDRDQALTAARALIPAAGANLYEGLRLGVDTLGPAVPGRHRRLVLVSAGKAAGIGGERMARLVRGFAEGGGGVTVVEYGIQGSAALLQGISDAGAGALYHTDNPGELPALFEREVGYSLIPVAERVQVRIAPGRSWRLREVFGLSQRAWSLAADAGRIEIPALFVAWRKEGGWSGERRGGGGGILIEVLPAAAADPRERPSVVADLELRYELPGGGGAKSAALQVVSPDGPGEVPSAGRFANASVEKGFVVLNLYVALRMAAERAAVGDLSGAYGVLVNIRRNAGKWEEQHPDLEIRDDLTYVDLFLSILEKKGATRLPPRAGWFIEPWPRD